MDAFSKARLKLTAWYLIIIMTLSLCFSVVVYRALTVELHRFESAQRFLIERRIQENDLPQPDRARVVFRHGIPMNPELIAETKQRILMVLSFANAGVLIVTGGIGFFLAGRTLKPIREMVDEQSRFITDASHELKTPITALRAEYEAAMLEEKKISKRDLKQLVRSSFEEITNLQALTEKLIELTQHQKYKAHTTREKVSLLEVIESALNKLTTLAKQRNTTINNQIEDYVLEGERQSLTEVFVVLLDNAIKYSPRGSEITLVSKKTDHHVQIEITDNGIGIDEKDIPYIFNRFWRVDQSRSKVKGHGLGLSIAKQIIGSHNGSISVQSKLGEETKFTIQLPITHS